MPTNPAAPRPFHCIVKGARSRICVEWKFGDMQQYWRLVCEWKHHRLLAAPVPKYMTAAAFFTNCVNCYYPNRTEKYFNCSPPSLPAYFATMRQPIHADLNAYHHYH